MRLLGDCFRAVVLNLAAPWITWEAYKNVDAQVLSQPSYSRISRYPYFVKASQESPMCSQDLGPLTALRVRNLEEWVEIMRFGDTV